VPTTTPMHVDGRGQPQGLALTATLPMTANAAAVVVTADGVELARRARSAHAPSARFLTPRPGSRIGRGATTLVRWSEHDADGDPLTAKLEYSGDGGRRWKVVADGLAGHSARVPSRFLSGSDNGRLRIRISDGFNVTTVVSGRLHAVGVRPVVKILDARSRRVFSDATVLLEAWAFDDASRRLTGRSLAWYAGKRLIGRGDQLGLNGLPAGAIAIRLIATDSRGRTGQAVLRLRVVAAPARYLVFQAPLEVSAHARRVRIAVASTATATFTIGRSRYAVSRRTRFITVGIRPGRSLLRLACALRSPGGVIRSTYLALR
jgi:hypothetical protein